MALLPFCQSSLLRNVQQEGAGIPLTSTPHLQPTKTCTGPRHPHPITPSILPIHHPSVHPHVGLWRPQCSHQTWAAARLTLSLRGPLSELSRGPSEPGVLRQLNLSSGQSEENRSRPISLYYGTALLLCCHVPVVLQGRRCLIHHQWTKGWVGGVGRGGGRRWVLPAPQTHTLIYTLSVSLLLFKVGQLCRNKLSGLLQSINSPHGRLHKECSTDTPELQFSSDNPLRFSHRLFSFYYLLYESVICWNDVKRNQVHSQTCHKIQVNIVKGQERELFIGKMN